MISMATWTASSRISCVLVFSRHKRAASASCRGTSLEIPCPNTIAVAVAVGLGADAEYRR